MGTLDGQMGGSTNKETPAELLTPEQRAEREEAKKAARDEAMRKTGTMMQAIRDDAEKLGDEPEGEDSAPEKE
jgi:hypothetical protein